MKLFKRTLAILMMICLCLTVFTACVETNAPETTAPSEDSTDQDVSDDPYAGQFRVGYGRTDITPEEPVPLGGYGNNEDRISTGWLNRLYFTAVAITDENDTTMLLLGWDISQADATQLSDYREYAKNKYGIDPGYVHLNGTHTHSSVVLGINSGAMNRYTLQLGLQARAAIDEAMASRLPAEMYGAETKTENLNFIRHYWREDGTSCGDNHGSWSSSPVVSHITEVDESMRIIKFTRTDADGNPAKDVVIVNWQAHNHLTGGMKKYDVASDWSGAFRTSLEEQKNCYFLFQQGCAGNINPKSYLKDEIRTTDYREHGAYLAGYVVDVYDNMTKLNTGSILSVTEKYEAPVNHDWDEMVGVAKTLYSYWKNNNYDTTGFLAQSEEYMIQSPYHANAISSRAGLGETYEVEVVAYRIGDFGCTSVPMEMFDQTGLEIRESSPFAITFTQGYTEYSAGYLPTAEAYEYGCYEADTTKYASGAAEGIRDKLIGMLRELYSAY